MAGSRATPEIAFALFQFLPCEFQPHIPVQEPEWELGNVLGNVTLTDVPYLLLWVSRTISLLPAALGE